MKNIFGKLRKFLESIFVVLLLLIRGVCLVFQLPLDYIRYKQSPFYKAEHIKYKPLAGMGIGFELYNEIVENELPINYIYNPNNDSLDSGWFVCDSTLIISNVFSFEYNTETEKWNSCCKITEEDGAVKRIIMSLDEYIEAEIQEANELAGDVICDKAIVLIAADCIENVELAKQEKRFLVYADDRKEVLKNFCNKKQQ